MSAPCKQRQKKVAAVESNVYLLQMFLIIKQNLHNGETHDCSKGEAHETRKHTKLVVFRTSLEYKQREGRLRNMTGARKWERWE
jgi:hypothetical protein